MVITNRGKYKYDNVIATVLWEGVDSQFNPVYFKGIPFISLLNDVHQFNPCALKLHVRVKHKNKQGEFLFFKANENHPSVAYNFYDNTDIFGTLTLISPKKRESILESIEKVKKNIKTTLEPHFGTVSFLTEDEGYVCYIQPVISPDDVSDGFYDKMEAYQGLNNLYFSNVYFTFSYTGLVMQYAKELVERFF